jgi:hypothetical protein
VVDAQKRVVRDLDGGAAWISFVSLHVPRR